MSRGAWALLVFSHGASKQAPQTQPGGITDCQELWGFERCKRPGMKQDVCRNSEGIPTCIGIATHGGCLAKGHNRLVCGRRDGRVDVELVDEEVWLVPPACAGDLFRSWQK